MPVNYHEVGSPESARIYAPIGHPPPDANHALKPENSISVRADYLADPGARTRWILAQRPDLDAVRSRLPVDRPGHWLVEVEPDESGRLAEVLAVFLTNRECPWRCLMCDLWRFTTLGSVPVGAIPAQIDYVLARWEPVAEPDALRRLKLYNAGSFFDRRAIPVEDHPAIAQRCAGFERVVVECHPALVGDAVLRFRDQLPPSVGLEVAMGLETAHPEVLARLNKGITLESFQRAAEFLKRAGIALRVFVLVQPPFLAESEAVDWAVRSVGVAFDAGASVVTLIPTRGGNGAMERLASAGDFVPPTIGTFEAAFAASLALRRGRVFADLWDLERFCTGIEDPVARKARLQQANQSQRWLV